MGPESLFVPRFAAEPPQDEAPTGRWAHRLREEFFVACLAIEAEEAEIGEPGELTFYPDRTYLGRTYVPITAPTSTGMELYGYVSYLVVEDGDPDDFHSIADFTPETASAHPEWAIDLCDEVIGGWRGEDGEVAAITLVWGVPMVDGAAVATAQLGDVVVDRSRLRDGCFTLVAPDDYRGATLDIRLFDDGGSERACESLYADDEDGDEDEDSEA